MEKNNFVKIGNVLKVNRKTGELSISVRKEIGTIPAAPSFILIEIDGGLVPFVPIEFEQSAKEILTLSLEDYNNPDKAHVLVGCNVFLEKKLLSGKTAREFLPEDLIGFKVVERKFGDLGTIEDVIESSMQTLLQISYNNKEILVPLADEFITSVITRRKIIYLDLPEGLLDLYL